MQVGVGEVFPWPPPMLQWAPLPPPICEAQLHHHLATQPQGPATGTSHRDEVVTDLLCPFSILSLELISQWVSQRFVAAILHLRTSTDWLIVGNIPRLQGTHTNHPQFPASVSAIILGASWCSALVLGFTFNQKLANFGTNDGIANNIKDNKLSTWCPEHLTHFPKYNIFVYSTM